MKKKRPVMAHFKKSHKYNTGFSGILQRRIAKITLYKFNTFYPNWIIIVFAYFPNIFRMNLQRFDISNSFDRNAIHFSAVGQNLKYNLLNILQV